VLRRSTRRSWDGRLRMMKRTLRKMMRMVMGGGIGWTASLSMVLGAREASRPRVTKEESNQGR
jgi:hypothetical protein